jgi:hypothetical protein
MVLPSRTGATSAAARVSRSRNRETHVKHGAKGAVAIAELIDSPDHFFDRTLTRVRESVSSGLLRESPALERFVARVNIEHHKQLPKKENRRS